MHCQIAIDNAQYTLHPLRMIPSIQDEPRSELTGCWFANGTTSLKRARRTPRGIDGRIPRFYLDKGTDSRLFPRLRKRNLEGAAEGIVQCRLRNSEAQFSTNPLWSFSFDKSERFSKQTVSLLFLSRTFKILSWQTRLILPLTPPFFGGLKLPQYLPLDRREIFLPGLVLPDGGDVPFR